MDMFVQYDHFKVSFHSLKIFTSLKLRFQDFQRGSERGDEDESGRREGIRGRVKFLPLAWTGMPKISFRKNSDSPERL